MKKLFIIACIPFLLSCFNASSESSDIKTGTKATKKTAITNKTTHQKSANSDSAVRELTISGRYNNIPEWYLKNRVQIHTLLGRNDINTEAFFGFPKRLAAMGVPVLTRQIKSGDEGPWWPTPTGTINPAAANYNQDGKNMAEAIIQQMHDLNMKAIIYYWHMSNAEMFNIHPDWADKDINGNKIRSPRGVYLCFNSPYRDVVIAQLKELAKYGADGFYFDSIHIPKDGCFCDYCKALYKKEYGSDLVADFTANKLQYYAFKNETIDRFFTDIRNSLHETGKNPVLLVSGNNWPAFGGLHMNSEIFHKFILKSEYEIPMQSTVGRAEFGMPQSFSASISPFYWNGFCFSFMRDNSAGPPHIWCPNLKNIREVNATAAAMVSLGCIANLHIGPKDPHIEKFQTPINWDKQFGEYFKSLVPYSYVGILASEKQRNQYLPTPAKAWNNVLIPAYNTFKKLYQAGIPVQIISDAGFTEPNISALKKIYCNISLTQPPAGIAVKSLTDNNSINALSGKALAKSIGAPVFCLKDDENIYVNYFKGAGGYMYIATGPDFTKNIRVRNKALRQNLVQMTSLQKTAITGNLHLYVLKTAVTSNVVENLVNKSTIKPAGTDGNYYVYTLKADYSSLGFFRFASKL